MECILHIAYRMDLEKWRVCKEDKAILQQKKLHIQQKLRDEIGLIVNVPQSSGLGSSNDGNTARRFFSDSERISEILAVDLDLLISFRTIWITISSGYSIDPDRFESYCENAAKRFVRLYIRGIICHSQYTEF